MKNYTSTQSVLNCLDAHGNAHAATYAQRGQATLLVCAHKTVNQRDEYARARATNRMA